MQLTPEQVQSVNILLNAVQVAQRRGAFSLQDAHTLQVALDNLVPREEQERQRQEALEQSNLDEVDESHVHDDNCNHDEEVAEDSKEDQVDVDSGSD